MSDISEAFLVAQEAALRGNADLADATGQAKPKIYVETPQNAVPPYIVLGEDDYVPDGEDDDCGQAGELNATVHLWVPAEGALKGSVRARRVGAVIEAILAGPGFAISGFDISVRELVSKRYPTDPDGSTHGVLLFRYLVARA